MPRVQLARASARRRQFFTVVATTLPTRAPAVPLPEPTAENTERATPSESAPESRLAPA